MKSRTTDPYEILGISKTATKDEIKAAYKKLVLENHPDKLVDPSPEQKREMTKRFREIQEAYESLTSPPAKQTPYSEPLSTMNPLEVDYLRAQFPALTHQEMEEFVKIINIFDLKDDASMNIINNDKSGRNFNKLDIDEADIFTLNELRSMLLYEPHLMQGLTVDEINVKLDALKAHYGDAKNLCNDFTFLWQAQKSGCGDIYIFGTVHVMSAALYKFIDALDALIEKSDVVMTEFETLQGEYGASHMSEYKSIDDYIANRAHALGKALRALETFTILKTTRSFDELKDPPEFAKLRKEAIAAIQAPDAETQRNLLQMLFSYSDSNKHHSTPLRNMLWMETILHASQTEKKKTLIACGAAHTRGASSIPNFLRHKGYTLTPLMKVLPLSNDEILRQSLFSQHTLFERPSGAGEKRLTEKTNISPIKRK